MSSTPSIPRLNGVIRAWEQGKPAIVSFVQTEVTPTAALRSTSYDAAVFEMEHGPYEIREMAHCLQYLQDRRHTAMTGSLAPKITPFARIPPNGSEMSQWHAKQVLDMGVYGVMWPHVSTVEEARNAVSACRYPRPPGSPRYEPAGMRGDAPLRSAQYWGLTLGEYYARADVWPLAPDGEIVVAIMCEEVKAIQNLPRMLKEVPGVGVVVIGMADLSQDMGLPNQTRHPKVLDNMQRALDICLEHKVACGLPGVAPEEMEPMIKKGFKWLMASPTPSYAALEAARKVVDRT